MHRHLPGTRAVARVLTKALLFLGILRVIFFPGGLNSFAILRGPISQSSDRYQQTAPELGQFVLHAWRNRGVGRSGDQTIALQTLQGEREHPLRYPLDCAAQLAEALLAITQLRHNEHAPFIADAIQNLSYRRTFAANMLVTR